MASKSRWCGRGHKLGYDNTTHVHTDWGCLYPVCFFTHQVYQLVNVINYPCDTINGNWRKWQIMYPTHSCIAIAFWKDKMIAGTANIYARLKSHKVSDHKVIHYNALCPWFRPSLTDVRQFQELGTQILHNDIYKPNITLKSGRTLKYCFDHRPFIKIIFNSHTSSHKCYNVLTVSVHVYNRYVISPLISNVFLVLSWLAHHVWLPVVTWWRHQMETFSALLAICAGKPQASGELPAQRPVTRSFDVFFDLFLNKRLRKQSWGWWFETLSLPLWRHCNGISLLDVFCGLNWPVACEAALRHLCHLSQYLFSCAKEILWQMR